MLYLGSLTPAGGEYTIFCDPISKNDHITCLKDAHVKSQNWDNEEDGVWNRICFSKASE
jgi:hypothetical protein